MGIASPIIDPWLLPIVDTHRNDLYLLWIINVNNLYILWILMGMSSPNIDSWPLPIVDTNGNDLYLLWILMGMTSTYCVYLWQ